MANISVLGNVGTYENYAFALGAATGQVAAATAGDLFQFRWLPPNGPTGIPTKKCRILRVTASAVSGATGFTAGDSTLALYVARAFTVADSGGTNVTPSGNSNKLRTGQQASVVSSIWVATTTNLTAGTRTLDAQSVYQVVLGDTATAGAQILAPTDLFYPALGSYSVPLVLAPSEGIVIQTTALAAAGTAQFAFNITWAEIDGGVNG